MRNVEQQPACPTSCSLKATTLVDGVPAHVDMQVSVYMSLTQQGGLVLMLL